MADETNEKPGKDPADKKAPKGSKIVFMLAAVLVVVVIASSAGYLVGSLFDKSSSPSPATEAERAAQAEDPNASQHDDYFYFEVKPPIVSTLDEPRLARYVRASIVLAILPRDKDKARELLEKKKPEIASWLGIRLAGCSLEKVRGEKNLNRLRREILDTLNQQFWPDQRPLIHEVLFAEFVVQ